MPAAAAARLNRGASKAGGGRDSICSIPWGLWAGGASASELKAASGAKPLGAASPDIAPDRDRTCVPRRDATLTEPDELAATPPSLSDRLRLRSLAHTRGRCWRKRETEAVVRFNESLFNGASCLFIIKSGAVFAVPPRSRPLLCPRGARSCGNQLDAVCSFVVLSALTDGG